MVQGGKTVDNYVKKLKLIKNSIGDISQRQLVPQFWKGANEYLRYNWLKDGYSIERATMKELTFTATKYEKARLSTKQENKRPNQRQGWREPRKLDNNGWSLNQKNSNSPRENNMYRPNNNRNFSNNRYNNNNNNSNSNNSNNYNNYRNNNNYSNNLQARSTRPDRRRSTYKSKEKIQELCAANKCFECEQARHLVKDCPRKNSLRPRPQIVSRVANIMEEGPSRLNLLDEASDLGLFSMRIGFVNDVGIEAPLAKDDDEILGLLIEEDDDIRSDEATLTSSSDSSNSEDSQDGDRALRNDFLYTILTSERHPTLTRDFLIFQLVRLLPFSWDKSYDISEIDTYDLNRFMIVEYIDDWLIADR